MAAIYKVTASALNLRAKPDKSSPALATMPRGEVVVGTEANSPPGWVAVNWKEVSGFASAAYLAAQTPTGAPASALPPAPSVETRDTNLLRLHPVVRRAVTDLLDALKAKGAPFGLFEGYRSPERQAWLYAQGRTRPGSIVTNAEPWKSYHQYGLACDLVLFENNRWSWSEDGPRAAWWRLMAKEAKSCGLRTLSFERPHVEYNGPDWSQMQKGLNFPPDGDASWSENLALNAERWRRGHGSPAAPPIELAERPPMAP